MPKFSAPLSVVALGRFFVSVRLDFVFANRNLQPRNRESLEKEILNTSRKYSDCWPLFCTK